MQLARWIPPITQSNRYRAASKRTLAVTYLTCAKTPSKLSRFFGNGDRGELHEPSVAARSGRVGVLRPHVGANVVLRIRNPGHDLRQRRRRRPGRGTTVNITERRSRGNRGHGLAHRALDLHDAEPGHRA